MKYKVLVIEDENTMREILEYILIEEGYEVDIAMDGKQGFDLMIGNNYDVIICDLRLPIKDGCELLREKVKRGIDSDFIMITAYGSVESAINAIKNGAEDYITKPFINDDLLLKVRKTVEHRSVKRENEALKKEIQSVNKSGFIVASKAMKDIYQLINKVAKYDSPVLVSGASGTGKELVAKAIHNNSERSGFPFVPINCGAIPQNLIESELFGHVKGAFTGSHMDKKGLFQQADQGTIFLDEIGDMDLSLQVKLLRVLQEKKVRRVGAVSPEDIDVRIIAATNKQLDKEILNGGFREDLYYRLNVIEISIPQLKDRKEDIIPLAKHFINKYNNSFGRSVHKIDSDVIDLLLNHDWPGNVRELEHLIQRAIILSDNDKIMFGDIESKLKGDIFIDNKSSYDLKNIVNENKKKIEVELINRVLAMTGDNRTEAAKTLGISHRALMYKIKEYKI